MIESQDLTITNFVVFSDMVLHNKVFRYKSQQQEFPRTHGNNNTRSIELLIFGWRVTRWREASSWGWRVAASRRWRGWVTAARGRIGGILVVLWGHSGTTISICPYNKMKILSTCCNIVYNTQIYALKYLYL